MLYRDEKHNDQIMTQFFACHNNSAVMTCAKLWHDCIIRIRIKAKQFIVRFQLCAHKPLVKWIPDLICLLDDLNELVVKFKYN